MPKPDDWTGQTVVIGTEMYGDDMMGTLEEVSDRGVVVRHEVVEVETDVVELETDAETEIVEAEIEEEATLQSIFYPWAKVNWMYHPEE